MSTSSPATTPTDRGAWKLVAARDFSVRLRDKGFLISTAITLTVVSVFIVISALGDDGPEVHRRTSVTPCRCSGTGGTPPPPCTTASAPTSSSRWLPDG